MFDMEQYRRQITARRKALKKIDPLKEVLDNLSGCLKEVGRDDRMGGYIITEFDRRKARKVLQQWLEKPKNKSRVSA
jgi:hypothetical protein